jgi:hypothetical protein
MSTEVPFLNTTEVFPEDDSQFLIKLTDVYSKIANNVNSREISIYSLSETATGQTWFEANSTNTPPIYRQAFILPSKTAGHSITIAHGITSLVAFTNIYGTAITTDGYYLPLPYVNASNVTSQIEVYCTSTNLVVVLGSGSHDISSGYIVLEYIQSS